MYLRKKKLFDFVHIYDIIKNKIMDMNDSNVTLYCSHIKKQFHFYNDFKKKDAMIKIPASFMRN